MTSNISIQKLHKFMEKNIEYQTTTTKMPHINHGGAFVVFLKLLIMTYF